MPSWLNPLLGVAALRTTIILAVLSTSAPATAQDAVWTDPTQRFTLAFEPLGWRPREDPPRNERVYFAIYSATAFERGKFLTCNLERLGPLPLTAQTPQATVNAGTTRFQVENLLRVAPGALNPSVSHTFIGDVAVSDLMWWRSFDGETIYSHWRTFFLASAEGAVQHQLQCAAVEPVSPADRAEIASLLSTLTFLPNP